MLSRPTMRKLRQVLLLLATLLPLAACGGGDDAADGSQNSGNNDKDKQTTGTSLKALTAQRSLAFPGADGGASTITGGTGGDVYVVSTLEDSGTGSLRSGIISGNRTIVFAIGGQINLKSKLSINTANLTIAGQTAPGDGITIAGYPVVIGSKANNVILRFLRFRLGDQNIENSNFSADDGDALGGKDCKNIMIDHCSISYSTDECASFSRVENFTMQYCIISESMKLAGHSKGNHGYGGIWGGRNASYQHNLLAHHDSRNPRFDHSYVGKTYRGPIDYVNNVVYNWGGNSTYGGESDSESNAFHINMVGNYYKKGPSSKNTNRLIQLTTYCTNCLESGLAAPAKLYLEGNKVNGSAATWAANVDCNDSKDTRDRTTLKSQAQLTNRWETGLTALSYTESADAAFNSVLDYAGASLKRDAVDERVVNDVKNGTGSIIDKVSDNPDKFFPTLAGGTPITDTDKDGMPDDWEMEQMKTLGVTDKTVSDFKPSVYNLSSKYTNLEVYLNSLVQGTFPAGAKATEIK